MVKQVEKKKRQAYPPQQSRSEQTMARLLDASERLLQKTPFELISVADIVREADSSVGAFYSRFGSKEVLLSALYDRYDSQLADRVLRACKKITSTHNNLIDASKAIVSFIVKTYRQQRWLMRAIALHARNHPELIDTEQRAKRSSLHRQLAELLNKYRKDITNLDKHAIEFGLFLVASAAREKILFAEAPHAAATVRNDRQLIEQLSVALIGYLQIPKQISK